MRRTIRKLQYRIKAWRLKSKIANIDMDYELGLYLDLGDYEIERSYLEVELETIENRLELLIKNK